MIDPELISLLRAGHGRMASFCSIGLDTGTEYLWTGVKDITYDGNVYKGVGSFGGYDAGEETVSEISGSFKLRLAAQFINAVGRAEIVEGFEEALGVALTDTPLQNRPVTVFQALLDPNGRQVLKVISQADGVIDSVEVTGSNDATELVLSVEDSAFGGTVAQPSRMTLAVHQRLNPGSDFLAQTALHNQTTEVWKYD